MTKGIATLFAIGIGLFVFGVAFGFIKTNEQDWLSYWRTVAPTIMGACIGCGIGSIVIGMVLLTTK
jgi:hypothetical protein